MKTSKLIIKFLVVLGLFSSTVYAETSATNHGSNAVSPYEFVFAPVLGYSSYNGFLMGLKSGLGVSVSTHWQIIGEVTYEDISSGTSKFDLRTGVQYNFSDVLRDSFYTGAGVGYVGSFTASDERKSALVFGRVGYRMSIGERFNWSPHISVSKERSATNVDISLLDFSFFF